MKALVDHLSQLIALPSISSANPALDTSNRPVIDWLANQLSERGFSIEIQTVTEAIDGQQAGKFNLIATLGTGSGGLVLAGHTDTVPFDEHQRQSNPFQLLDANHRFYGLGSTDMKGFFALVIKAITDIQQQLGNQQLQQPLIILATADEETSMAGAKALAAAGNQTQLPRWSC